MWKIRDSDGSETLHALYPSWAKDLPHLTVVEMVEKAQYEELRKELQVAKTRIAEMETMARQHMSAMRQRGDRLRNVEASCNRYYGILQRYQLTGDLPVDDSPIISVKV